MTRDELIEIMALAMDSAAGTRSAPPFSATWGEHAAAVLDAMDFKGLAIVPYAPTDAMAEAATGYIRDESKLGAIFAYSAMIGKGRI